MLSQRLNTAHGTRVCMHARMHAGKIAEDPVACAAIAREVGAIQQLILMALSDSEVVVQQACKTIGARLCLQNHRCEALPCMQARRCCKKSVPCRSRTGLAI